ncbi:DUF418 domain-containing protein [Croceicoccus naphthovorans]|uniref:Uncharacterized protein n=1 Tax=Croceicoccus naphthovorans TaxID=1348774 RepID=A0A0G3XLK1_9SPHN|nr:DUF418 domain-containing protein [Croceicoccus naphthovorans]AKM11506.1 hypothetical protein AB433_03275 [Croceicoccus naphthovorans]MBB3990406.1 uncharacterized protein [Croceicoccus naphthovorans]
MADDPLSPQATERTGRIATLDLARGFAVLGILAINVTTIAGPGLATANPDWHGQAQSADWVAFGVSWIVFEGKMRAMFATLFGVSLVLFLSRGEEVSRVVEQVRRLLWLAVFGYLHFALFWWGDILLTYAIAGMIALFFKDLRAGSLFVLGLGGLAYLSVAGALEGAWGMHLGAVSASGVGSPSDLAAAAETEAAIQARVAEKMAEYAMGFWEAIRYRLTVTPDAPLRMAAFAVLEALPLMLCGMGLGKSGFFTGGWSRRALLWAAGCGLVIGVAWYGAMLAYAASVQFSSITTELLPYRYGIVGRVAMVAGYLALLALFGAAIARSGPGARIAAAGRMAFSNYLGTTVVMTFIFHGWGLNLGAYEYGQATLVLFVLLGWTLMLGWSRPWLARFGIGPLEWLWRKLAGMGIRRAALVAR